MTTKSQQLFEKAKQLIPGGVNSPVRACKAVGTDPKFISSASGSRITDADGKIFIDYIGSWGPMILGHAYPAVIKAIQDWIPFGTSYGAPTELEVEMAETIARMVPSIEMVRMVSSGTEAAMSAIRLARGFTGRDNIIKFDGCYHGHGDSLLVAAGSGVATLGIPGSPGIPRDLAAHTISLPYNDLDAVEKAFKKFGDSIAAVIVEPVAGNMGCVLPAEGFLPGLRTLTLKYGALLIFDEVITGFRLALGGAQELFGITPDLTCLGKIIGGGLPVGAFGGKKTIMSHMAPEGNIYQAGTLSGNPIAMAAGLATIKELERLNPYADLEKKSDILFKGLSNAAENAGFAVVVNKIGSLGSLFFTKTPVVDFSSALKADQDIFRVYYNKMLNSGIYLAPSAFEVMFISAAHSDIDIAETIESAKIALSPYNN